MFSTGAGVDQFDLRSIPDSIKIVRLIDPAIVAGMREYISFAVLALHRDVLDYRSAQAAGSWRPLASKAASDVRVGIMGLGVLGLATLNILRYFEFQLNGWSRTRKEIEDVRCYAGSSELYDFASACDIIVCLLPLTEETRGILDTTLFNAMPNGAGLVNVGRGGHLQEDDLIAALDDGKLSGAIIDVLKEEPAGPDHPFWLHPRIMLTPHIASMTGIDSAASALLEEILRHERGEPMLGAVNRVSGY